MHTFSVVVVVVIVTGNMIGCPGYLGVTVNDRFEEEELFHYDVLVPCSTGFNLSFVISISGTSANDKFFDVVLDDTQHKYRIFLMYYWSQNSTQVAASVTDLKNNDICLYFVSVMFFIVMFVIVTAIVTHILLRILRSYQNMSSVPYASRKRSLSSLKSRNRTRQRLRVKSFFLTGSESNRSTNLCIVVYCLLKVVYSIFVTFLMALMLTMTFLRQPIHRVSELNEINVRCRNASNEIYQMSQNHLRTAYHQETERSQTRSNACNSYVQSMFESFFQRIHNSTLTDIGSSIRNMIRDDFKRRLDAFHERLAKRWDQQRQKIHKTLEPHLKRYKTFLKRFYNSNWLLFPRSLFNVSQSQGDEYHLFHGDFEETDVPASKEKLMFQNFFIDSNADRVITWPVEFLQG